MVITKRVDIDKRQVFVCDDIFPRSTVKDIHEYFRRKAYIKDARYGPNVEKTTWVTPLSNAAIKRTDIYKRIVAAVTECFPGNKFHMYRAYCNCLLFGDHPHIHRDHFPGSTDITTVYYVNSVWDPEWWGETIFYDEKDDAALAVSPRPGRLNIAHATLKHRAGIPSRDCYVSRLTLVMSFRVTPIKARK